MNHFATPEFWFHYHQLPDEIRAHADKCFALLKADARHPSLRLKKVGVLWSARVGYDTVRSRRSELKVWSGFGLAHIPDTTS